MVAERFGAVGKGKGSVTIDDQFLTFEHRLLKHPVTVPGNQIVSVVRMVNQERDSRLLLRPFRSLRLPMGAPASNVVVLLNPRLNVTGFKSGSDKALHLRGRERRKGADFDAIGVTVDDPDGLAAALERRGITRVGSLAQASVDLCGEATGEAAVAVRARARRARIKAQALLSVMSIVYVFALAGRLAGAGDDDRPFAVHHWLQLSGAGFAWAAVVAAFIALRTPTRSVGPPRPIADRPDPAAGRKAFVAIAVMALAVGACIWARISGVPAVIAFAPLVGTPSGVLVGYTLRGVRLVRAATTGLPA